MNFSELKKSAYPNSIINGKKSNIFSIEENKCVNCKLDDEHVFFLGFYLRDDMYDSMIFTSFAQMQNFGYKIIQVFLIKYEKFKNTEDTEDIDDRIFLINSEGENMLLSEEYNEKIMIDRENFPPILSKSNYLINSSDYFINISTGLATTLDNDKIEKKNEIMDVYNNSDGEFWTLPSYFNYYSIFLDKKNEYQIYIDTFKYKKNMGDLVGQYAVPVTYNLTPEECAELVLEKFKHCSTYFISLKQYNVIKSS